MDIFKLAPSRQDYFELTEVSYFTRTQRRPPYSAKTKSGKPLFLAVCPECNNPIEIRNLGPIDGENKNYPLRPFGKHYIFDVPGLALSNPISYSTCSLRGKISIGTREHRGNDEFNKEILRLLVEQAAVVRDLIATCIGVTVGQTLFERIIEEFISREAYKSKGVQPANLPYAVIYWSENQNLWGQIVNDNKLIEAINNDKFGWFKINADCKIQSTQLAPFKSGIRFYFPQHRKGNDLSGEPNTITLCIARYHKEPLGEVIYRKTISYYNNDFFNTIRREKNYQSESALAKNKRWSEIAMKIVMKYRPDSLVDYNKSESKLSL
ncbi:hypothetical protein [Aquitalea sp.]|uniref:hypothetical protein n=1 Tax=Aquitalea sp. TaxID=1872623 RepID=UPI002590CF2B|nr:hypothetical protein [Aquitalea sp.]